MRICKLPECNNEVFGAHSRKYCGESCRYISVQRRTVKEREEKERRRLARDKGIDEKFLVRGKIKYEGYTSL